CAVAGRVSCARGRRGRQGASVRRRFHTTVWDDRGCDTAVRRRYREAALAAAAAPGWRRIGGAHAAPRALSRGCRPAAAFGDAAASQARTAPGEEMDTRQPSVRVRSCEVVCAATAWRKGADGDAARSSVRADAEAGTPARPREKTCGMEPARSGGDSRAGDGSGA